MISETCTHSFAALRHGDIYLHLPRSTHVQRQPACTSHGHAIEHVRVVCAHHTLALLPARPNHPSLPTHLYFFLHDSRNHATCLHRRQTSPTRHSRLLKLSPPQGTRHLSPRAESSLPFSSTTRTTKYYSATPSTSTGLPSTRPPLPCITS
jgi:hypothetical protein